MRKDAAAKIKAVCVIRSGNKLRASCSSKLLCSDRKENADLLNFHEMERLGAALFAEAFHIQGFEFHMKDITTTSFVIQICLG